jgi:UDP-glucuronate decarboxylase
MTELASEIISLTESRSKLEFRELPPDDPRQRRPDISKATRVLGWGPTVNLRAGLIRTIECFRRRLDELAELGPDRVSAR